MRRSLVEQWMDEAREKSRLGIPECEIQFDRACAGRAIEAHEPKLRSRGGDIYDRNGCLLTCRHCHDAVHLAVGADLERAYKLGFLVHSWD